MPRQTSKGGGPTPRGNRSKKEAAFERHQAGASVPHHHFVGEVAQEREHATLSEMAQEFEHEAGLDGAAGPELRAPRSLDEARQLFRELRDDPARLRALRDRGPELLREKARERLEAMPEPVRRAVGRADEIALLLFAPVRAGVHLVAEVLRIPGAMARAIFRRRQEA